MRNVSLPKKFSKFGQTSCLDHSLAQSKFHYTLVIWTLRIWTLDNQKLDSSKYRTVTCLLIEWSCHSNTRHSWLVHISCITRCVIPSKYYTCLFFCPLVFYLFSPSVKNLVLWFSIYSVLRIRFNGPACKITIQFLTIFLINFKSVND